MTEGERVTLDTRLLFGERGYCQCIQEVTLLRVKRGSYSSLPIFNCAEVGNNCNNTVINGEEFIVERSLSGQPYDFSLVLPPVDMSSIYYVEVEVMQPGVTSRPRFWKIFNVTVYPGEFFGIHRSCLNYSCETNSDTCHILLCTVLRDEY